MNIVGFLQIQEGLIHFWITRFILSCFCEEGTVFVYISSAQHMVHSPQQVTPPSFCILQDCSCRLFCLFNFPSVTHKGVKNLEPFAMDIAVGSKIERKSLWRVSPSVTLL